MSFKFEGRGEKPHHCKEGGGVHERHGGGLGCRRVDLRGGSGFGGVGPQFCQTTRESLAWIRSVHKCST